MSDFLSKLIARSFSDAPAIQPRVPSLFEPTAVEFFDEPQSSALTPASELSPVEQTTTAKSIANVSDTHAEEDPPKLASSAHKDSPTIRQPAHAGKRTSVVRKLDVETKRMIIPLGPEPRPVEFGRAKDFSPVEQRSSTSSQIIRVTIGRVEVRAIHPPAPAPKPVKPVPPKLSLEDYLHQRERGSR